MLKTLGAQVKQYRWVTFITPVFSALEAVADMFLPMLMSRIIDKGVKVGGQAGMQAVLHYGAIMVAVAIGALVCGILAGRFASIASTGFAANLRQAMFANIQSFSFSNIDRFSTAGLVTRLTTDVSNVQLSYQMITRICVRAPVMLITALIMAFSIHASLSMIFVVAIVILAAALSFIIFKATGTFNRVFKKYDDLNASVQENVGAIRVVKAFVREDYERSKFNKAANAVYRMFVKAETTILDFVKGVRKNIFLRIFRNITEKTGTLFPTCLPDCLKTCLAESFGGKESVKGNRQGVLSRQITRRSGRIAKSCCKI